MKKLPIGISNFRKLRIEDFEYVDKTLLIKQIIDEGIEVSLFPRPRRFGKTLTMSMLDNYFNIAYKDEEDIFEGLKIKEEGEIYSSKQNKYPVIYITLKEVKGSTWENEYNMLKEVISELYFKHKYLLEILDEIEVNNYNKILDKTASFTQLQISLKRLTEYLYRYYNQKVIVLIDEYDSLIEASYIHGFYTECIEFMRTFLGSALKDNDYLEFSVITGILKISKESIFSDLNSFKAHSILDEEYNEYFGFEKEEVYELLERYNLSDTKADVDNWYNGYMFGDVRIYNPWSILNFLYSKGKLNTYWVNTSGNALIKQIFNLNVEKNSKLIEKILKGEKILARIDTEMVYASVESNVNTIATFLLMTGYLTVDEKIVNKGSDIEYISDEYYLKIPNLEVKMLFKKMITTWFTDTSNVSSITLLRQSLINNNMEEFSKNLNELLVRSSSSFDSNESFYHGVMFMLLSSFGDEYIVESNKEEGYGRYDLKLIRRDKSFGAIFEFKFAKKEEDLEKLAIDAYNQIKEKNYDHNLISDGIKDIRRYGISFRNKKAKVYYE